MNSFSIKILGSRGTIAQEGEDFSVYGGSTSCIYIEVGDEVIVLDGGSGILSLPQLIGEKKRFHLLLSHLHIDHIVGIMACPIFYDPEFEISLYAYSEGHDDAKNRLDGIMSPPLWPVNSDAFRATVRFVPCLERFSIGSVTVERKKGFHPGGCSMFRINCGEKSLVYATDYEINDNTAPDLARFAQGCTLLLCDGQYTRDELSQKKGFGHSCWDDACNVAIRCGAERLGIIHHDPYRTDKQINEMQNDLKKSFPNGFFAYRMQEIAL